ncbi:hypothetical protein [Sphingobacterium sp. 18053]|uniref:hypothetical protein n=1 Tax=Sphingobacterium sp. 18053 TaxID=2681401 RepID=UPI00135B0201|nr:hypothetical protein [Sphingobacterium sp. 18053]
MAKGDKLYFKALKEASKNTEIGDSNALELLQKAIDKNNSKAQYALATWYLWILRFDLCQSFRSDGVLHQFW